MILQSTEKPDSFKLTTLYFKGTAWIEIPDLIDYLEQNKTESLSPVEKQLYDNLILQFKTLL